MYKHRVGCSALKLAAEEVTESNQCLCKESERRAGSRNRRRCFCVCNTKIASFGCKKAKLASSLWQYCKIIIPPFFFLNLCVISLSHHLSFCLIYFPSASHSLPAAHAQAGTLRCTLNMVVLWKVNKSSVSVRAATVLLSSVWLQYRSVQHLQSNLPLWACVNRWHVCLFPPNITVFLLPDDGATWKVKITPKWLQLILYQSRPFIYPIFQADQASSSGDDECLYKMAINSKVVEIFQSGLKWCANEQRDRHCHPSNHAASIRSYKQTKHQAQGQFS